MGMKLKTIGACILDIAIAKAFKPSCLCRSTTSSLATLGGRTFLPMIYDDLRKARWECDVICDLRCAKVKYGGNEWCLVAVG